MEVQSDRWYRLSGAPEQVWSALTRVQDYQRWWPWLRAFDATAFAAGEQWCCEVQPPLPYRLRFTIHLDEVVAERSAKASITGDIAGSARIELSPAAAGTDLHLVSSLGPSTGLLRTVVRVAGPVARYGHDWVIDTGLRQFESRALAGAPD